MKKYSKLPSKSDFFLLLKLLTYDKVSANTASSVPKCYKKTDGSQDACRGSPERQTNNSIQHMYGRPYLGLKDTLPPTPYPHTYSGPSGHKDSPPTIQNVPYLLKKLRLSDRFFGIFFGDF